MLISITLISNHGHHLFNYAQPQQPVQWLRKLICSAIFLSRNQQHNATHKRNSSNDRRQRKRFGFLRRHLQWTKINDFFSGRIREPLIPKGHNPQRNK